MSGKEFLEGGNLTQADRDYMRRNARANADAGKEQAPIPREVNRLDRRASELAEVIEVLSTRLEPVLGPPVPRAEGNTPSPDSQSGSDVTIRLNEIEGRLRQIQNDAHDLIKRLEV